MLIGLFAFMLTITTKSIWDEWLKTEKRCEKIGLTRKFEKEIKTEEEKNDFTTPQTSWENETVFLGNQTQQISDME